MLYLYLYVTLTNTSYTSTVEILILDFSEILKRPPHMFVLFSKKCFVGTICMVKYGKVRFVVLTAVNVDLSQTFGSDQYGPFNEDVPFLRLDLVKCLFTL